MASRLVLLHSPLLGPLSWRAVAARLRERGLTVETPAWPRLSTLGRDCYAALANSMSATLRPAARHAAAAPGVRADVGFLPYSRSFNFFVRTYGPATNGQQADITTAAGKYDVVVRVAANGARVSAVPSANVAAGKLTAVYAVGTPGSTFSFIVQQIPLA